MLSLDLSTTNILMIAAVVALFILFVTVLMKLNPSTEAEETVGREVTIESPEPIRTEPSVPQKYAPIRESIPATVEKPVVVLNATVGGPSIQTARENTKPTVIERREVIAKPEKAVAPTKAAIGSSSKRDCLHQFGYLRTLPKNAPIPDECFGCPKIVECLVKAKTR